MRTRLLALLSLIVVLGLFLGTHGTPISAQEPEATRIPPVGELPPDLSQPVPDDIRLPVKPNVPAQAELSIAASDYKVIPILLVPRDVTPNLLALPAIDKQMQLIQRWYGEQLLDRTFSLEPARLVVGSRSLADYYGDCYPSSSSCAAATYLWGNIWNDLANLGYPWRPNRIVGVFFQHEGVGSAGLGGSNQFLIGIDPGVMFADCLEPGCVASVSEGGAAHELGHALGLPHTAGDEGGSSVMLFGFYFFPRAHFTNSPQNPEKDMLYASPFLNRSLSLKNSGFEGCLASWKIISGAARCNTPPPSHDRSRVMSGLSSLELAARSQVEVRQTVSAVAGKTYNFSGWLNIPAQTRNFMVQIKIQALSSSGSVLSTFTVANFTEATEGWRRRAASITMPARTVRVHIRLIAQGLSAPVYVDDLGFLQSQTLPPVPLPAFHSNGDTIRSLQPKLRWSNVTASTSYQLQLATNSNFNTRIVNTTFTSPFYNLPKGLLTYDTRYYWRVRAINSAGNSGWSPTWNFIVRSASNYYNDEFEAGMLNTGWSWVREAPGYWGFGGPLTRRGTGYVGIKMQPGDLLGGLNNAQNLLLRTPPSGDFEVSTAYDLWPPMTSDYEQAGLVIYQDDDNYIKLVRLYDSYHKVALLAEVNGATVQQVSTPLAGWVHLKIVRTGNAYSGYYSPDDGYTWRSLGQPNEVNWSSPKIGLMAFSQRRVNPDPNQWVVGYFEHFRVRTYDQPLSLNVSNPKDYNAFLPLILK